MDSGEKSWFVKSKGTDGQSKAICTRHNRSAPRKDAPSFTAVQSLNLVVGRAATDHKAITCPHRSRRVSAWRTAPSVGRPLPEPHCVSDNTEGCKQHSRPAQAQRTEPTISLDLPSRPTSPLPATQSKPSASITESLDSVHATPNNNRRIR